MLSISIENKKSIISALADIAKLYIVSDERESGIKKYFFPQTENLMEFKMKGKSIEIIDTRTESEEFIIFGASACDVKSLEILDRVFLKEPVDTYYKNRREHGIIIAQACNYPKETCFCSTFNIDAADPESDIVCYDNGKRMILKAKTDKGESLLDRLKKVSGELKEQISENDLQKQIDVLKDEIHGRIKELPLAGLDIQHLKEGQDMDFFDSPKWEELSKTCISCGTCTFVCPTCHCYDIRDFDTGSEVKRFRCWDSCMYSEFTKMSAGQPRLTRIERFRQRFMHKLFYYPENHDGLFACVGCGRCLMKCPVQMNIVKVIRKLGGSK